METKQGKKEGKKKGHDFHCANRVQSRHMDENDELGSLVKVSRSLESECICLCGVGVGGRETVNLLRCLKSEGFHIRHQDYLPHSRTSIRIILI